MIVPQRTEHYIFHGTPKDYYYYYETFLDWSLHLPRCISVCMHRLFDTWLVWTENELTVRITGNVHAFYGIVSTRNDKIKTRDRFSRNEYFIVTSNDTITSQGNFFFVAKWKCIVCLRPVNQSNVVLPFSHVSVLHDNLQFRF